VEEIIVAATDGQPDEAVEFLFAVIPQKSKPDETSSSRTSLSTNSLAKKLTIIPLYWSPAVENGCNLLLALIPVFTLA
jgi:hypothetical protein